MAAQWRNLSGQRRRGCVSVRLLPPHASSQPRARVTCAECIAERGSGEAAAREKAKERERNGQLEDLVCCLGSHLVEGADLLHAVVALEVLHAHLCDDEALGGSGRGRRGVRHGESGGGSQQQQRGLWRERERRGCSTRCVAMQAPDGKRGAAAKKAGGERGREGEREERRRGEREERR